MFNAIKNEKISLIGKIFNSHWKLKNLTNEMSDKDIDKLYSKIQRLVGFGGKLIGAGGGGFFGSG